MTIYIYKIYFSESACIVIVAVNLFSFETGGVVMLVDPSPFARFLRRRCRPRPPGILRRLIADRSGAVMVTVAFALIIALGFIGLGIDAGRAYLVRSRLSSALDAAGLAQGGNTSGATDAASIAAYVKMYFDANFPPDFMGVGKPVPTITGDGLETPLVISASVSVPTTFMRLFGFETMPISATAGVNQSIRAMELVLVLDNTGSLGLSNMEAIRAASHDLVNIVYGGLAEHSNLWVGVVPYTSTINIGTDRLDWIDGSDPFKQDATIFGNSTGTYNPLKPNDGGWKGCIAARPDPYDTVDDPPSAKLFNTFLYPQDAGDNDWSAGIRMNEPSLGAITSSKYLNNCQWGPNLGCPSPILPLTKQKATVDTAVDAMAITNRGGTTSNLGLLWGWRMLSPKWRSAWGGAAEAEGRPLAYDDPSTDKVIVIMTDGENQFYNFSAATDNGNKCSLGKDGSGNTIYKYPAKVDDHTSDYTAYGRITSCSGTKCNTSGLDSDMTDMCAAIKANNIRVYSIIFGTSVGAATKILFENCATAPNYYFETPTATDLRAAFRKIGKQLSNLRISQ
jgi:Flp pilus assembly protein TadG